MRPSVHRLHASSSSKAWTLIDRNGTQREQEQAGGQAHAPVPDGTPGWITPELIAATLNHWQSYYREVLTEEDAVEILLNTAHLLDLLEE